MLKILIVDDHPIVAEGIRKLIQDSKIASVAGVAGTGKACLDFLKWEKPDIILLDINLPDISGIELCKTIKEKYSSLKILAITTFNERSCVVNMMNNGADGYVLKNTKKTLLSIFISIALIFNSMTLTFWFILYALDSRNTFIEIINGMSMLKIPIKSEYVFIVVVIIMAVFIVIPFIYNMLNIFNQIASAKR